MSKSQWIPITDIHKIDPETVDWKKLEKALAEIRQHKYTPDISIYTDNIGTEIHFNSDYFDDQIITRDFGGKDTGYFFLLMLRIAEHNWKEAIKVIEEYFIYGKSEEKGK